MGEISRRLTPHNTARPARAFLLPVKPNPAKTCRPLLPPCAAFLLSVKNKFCFKSKKSIVPILILFSTLDLICLVFYTTSNEIRNRPHEPSPSGIQEGKPSLKAGGKADKP